MREIWIAFKHMVCGIHNIPKILFGSASLVDEDMKKSIIEGRVEYPKTVDVDLCLGCGVCSNVCPVKCITMKDLPEPVETRPGQTKDKYPEIDIEKCCFCYQCHDSCPTFTVHKTDAAINPRGVRITGKTAKDLYEAQDKASKLQKKMVTVDEDLCLGCGVCAAVCPVKCITMEPTDQKEEFPNGQVKDKIPRIDISKCIKCGACKNGCLTAKVHKRPAAIDPNGLEPSGINARDLFEKEEKE